MRSPTEGDTATLTMNLLHAGASLHGHEYSPAPSPSTCKLPRIPLRSYNSTPIRRSSYQDTSKTSTNTLSSTYIRPARRLSNSRRRTITERVSFLDKPIDIHTSFTMPMPGSLDYESSDDGMSISSSQISAPSACSHSTTSKRRFTKHPETNYYLAGPAPTMGQRQRLLHIRPKMVLQLQKVPPSGRPVPILEVKSSSTFVPRIAKKFPGLYKGTGQLGINDVMICKSENYHTGNGEEGEGPLAGTTCGTEAYDENEVIAVICQAPKDSGYSGELCFDDGTRWVMKRGGKKGALELSKTNPITGEVTVARWVPAGMNSRRASFQTPVRGQAKGAADVREKETGEKYNFSMIDPSRRRHPVMASLKQTGLTVKDTYSPADNTPASSTASLAASMKAMGDGDAADANAEEVKTGYPLPPPSPTEIIRTTEDQKLLIEISAVWLASRLGWCPWSDAVHATPVSSPATPAGSKSADRQRSSTLGANGSGSVGSKHRRQRSGTVGSIAEGGEPDSDTKTKSNMGSLTKRSGNIFKRLSLAHPPYTSESEHSPPRSGSQRTTPKRSVSTGAAFMQRQAEKRSSRPPSESGSRPGSTTVSRNNSRPSSPKRACSMDILSSFGRNVSHGEALTKGLAKYDNHRNSLPTSPEMRRAQSEFTAYDGSHSSISSPHLKIGEAVKPAITPTPLVHGKETAPPPMTRRQSATGHKSDGKAMPKRAATVPSRRRNEVVGQDIREAQVVKKKVSKMKAFIGIFSKTQRRKNEAAGEGR